MKISVFFLMTFLTTHAFSETVLSTKTVNLMVDISTTRLKLSESGYSTPTVKVLIPELADVTVLNHRNPEEDAPCLATFDTFEPEDVIQNNPGIEKVDFEITLTKHTFPDESNKICMVSLVEKVKGNIRGFAFSHNLVHMMPERHIEDCR